MIIRNLPICNQELSTEIRNGVHYYTCSFSVSIDGCHFVEELFLNGQKKMLAGGSPNVSIFYSEKADKTIISFDNLRLIGYGDRIPQVDVKVYTKSGMRI